MTVCALTFHQTCDFQSNATHPDSYQKPHQIQLIRQAASLTVCVCVCVSENEREREREGGDRDKARERESEREGGVTERERKEGRKRLIKPSSSASQLLRSVSHAAVTRLRCRLFSWTAKCITGPSCATPFVSASYSNCEWWESCQEQPACDGLYYYCYYSCTWDLLHIAAPSLCSSIMEIKCLKQ